ncbi:MAG: PepSY domain-containing protein [Methylococcus sp.]
MQRNFLFISAAVIGFMGVTSSAMAGRSLAEAEVPPAVVAAFKSAYPNATGIEYEEETEKGQPSYEVEFTSEGKKWEVDYTPDGKVLKTEQDD